MKNLEIFWKLNQTSVLYIFLDTPKQHVGYDWPHSVSATGCLAVAHHRRHNRSWRVTATSPRMGDVLQLIARQLLLTIRSIMMFIYLMCCTPIPHHYYIINLFLSLNPIIINVQTPTLLTIEFKKKSYLNKVLFSSQKFSRFLVTSNLWSHAWSIKYRRK